MMADKPFKPALVVVDFQEDFCPPNGSLAVPFGRDISPIVNALLLLPFAVKLATRDWHPRNHISFASNHPGTTPFTSTTVIRHPCNASQTYTSTLWPDHCIQDTPGAQLVPELDVSQIQQVIDKGKDPRVEMYSAFYDPFHWSDSGLKDKLKGEGVTDVFVVGLASDFCVKATAEHAVDEGFASYIVEEGTKPVMPDKWPTVREGLIAKGVNMVSIDGDEVAKVKAL